jgi:BolA protein
MKKKHTMKATHDRVLERFRQAFPTAAIVVENESHLDTNYPSTVGNTGCFRVRVIDPRFNGLHRIARHWLIYDAVSDWMSERMHALTIIPMTLKEAKQVTADPHAAVLFDIEHMSAVFYIDN